MQKVSIKFLETPPVCANKGKVESDNLALAAGCHQRIQKMFEIEPGPAGRRLSIANELKDSIDYIKKYQELLIWSTGNKERCAQDPHHQLESEIIQTLIIIQEEALAHSKSSATFRKLKRKRYNLEQAITLLREGLLIKSAYEIQYGLSNKYNKQNTSDSESLMFNNYGAPKNTLLWNIGLANVVAKNRDLPDYQWQSYKISEHDATILNIIGKSKSHEIMHMPVSWLGTQGLANLQILKMLGWFEGLRESEEMTLVLLNEWEGTLGELQYAIQAL